MFAGQDVSYLKSPDQTNIIIKTILHLTSIARIYFFYFFKYDYIFFALKKKEEQPILCKYLFKLCAFYAPRKISGEHIVAALFSIVLV